MAAHKDTVPRIIEILRDEFQGGPFVTFYDGDPELIPVFNLPAVIVTQTGDENTLETNATDEVTEQVVIKVVYNKKDDWADDVDPLNMTEKKIREVIGRIDPDTGRYGEQTVKRALREHLSEQNMILDGPMTVVLGINPRANDVMTAEGHVTVTVKYSVNVETN
jgi:hypothetical protein